MSSAGGHASPLGTITGGRGFPAGGSQMRNKKIAIAIAAGIAAGASVGTATDNIGMGVGIGLALGIAFGSAWKAWDGRE